MVLRSWDKYERRRNVSPVIDYDCCLLDQEIESASSRLAVLRQLEDLRERAGESEDSLCRRIDAELTYLRALLGEHRPLDEYVLATQGCHAAGWPEQYVTEVREKACESLNALGIPWGSKTLSELAEAEGPLDADAASAEIRHAANVLEPAVRQVTGANARYELSIEATEVDAYWSYWLDGAGQRIRLRLNLGNSRFTKVRARQFALHEVLGHGLHSASYAARCSDDDVPWVPLLSVYALNQVLLEGLAQAMPLFVAPDDK